MWWINNQSNDKREERSELKRTTSEWQKELDARGLEEDDRKRQMNENYKSHIGQTAKQIAKSRDGNTNDVRASLTPEELNRENRLEKKQIENIKEIYWTKETKEELNKTRKDKKSWWD